MQRKLFLTCFLFGVFVIQSCGGSAIENDAEKLADIMCQTEELSNSMIQTETPSQEDVQKMNQLLEEMKQVELEMKEKYGKNEKDINAFEKHLHEKLKACGIDVNKKIKGY